MNFGDKIRQLRKDKNFTQPELAEAMGIEQSYLSKLENGKSLPSNDVLARTDEEYLRTNAFAGIIFNVPVEGGSRTYYLRDDTRTDPWQNKAITFVGVLMLVFGIVGLVLEKKLSRYQ